MNGSCYSVAEVQTSGQGNEIRSTVCSWAALWRVSFFLIIYFWLRRVFVTASRLSLVAASRGYSSLQWNGFSLRWLHLMQSTGVWVSVVVTHRLWGMWNLPGPGIEPMSPALASDSNPPYHQGSPRVSYTMRKLYLIWAFSKFPPPM